MRAPIDTTISFEAADLPKQAEQVEAVIEAIEASPVPLQFAETRAAVESFNAVKELPSQWVTRLDDVTQCKSTVEASVKVLRMEVGKYREQLVNIDSEVRRCIGSPSSDRLQAALGKLREVTSEWMDQQAETANYLLERRKNLGDLVAVRDRLDEVLQTQADQIEATCGNLEMFDFEASPVIGARRLAIEVRKLVDLAHVLRDCMHELLLTILVREGRLGSCDKALLTDGLTGLKNRTGIETFIRKWWHDDGRRIRQVSVAMFDIDEFSHIVERFGARVTDQLLAAVARLVDDMLRKYSGLDWCGRFSGQRFFMFWADTGPHGATSFVERIRQAIAKTTFEAPQGPIELTFSAAVTEVLNDDTTKSLFKRLNWTLQAAKNAGRNCTFLCKEGEPAAVEPPEFDVRGKIMRIDV
jgi:diguanylate cyclase (GGDEF)-like protein